MKRETVYLTTNLTFLGTEFEIRLEINYIPKEPMVLYYPDESGHPGSPAEIDIITARAYPVELLNKETKVFFWYLLSYEEIDSYLMPEYDNLLAKVEEELNHD